MSVYANSINLNINEVAIIDFNETSQSGVTIVAKVAMIYPFLKEFHTMIGEAIEQHDKKLGELQRSKANMN